MPGIQRIDGILNFTGIVRGAQSEACLGERIQNVHLVEVMRAFIDVCHMDRALKGADGKIRSSALELSHAKPTERIDELGVEAIFVRLDDLYSGLKILLGRIVLLRSVLDYAEIGQCPGGVGGVRS